MPDWRRLQDITTDITKAEDEKDTAQQNVRDIEVRYTIVYDNETYHYLYSEQFSCTAVMATSAST
jgi:hypothetical protein